MVKTIAVFLFLIAVTFGQDMAKDETQVWNLEKAYWEYVKANETPNAFASRQSRLQFGALTRGLPFIIFILSARSSFRTPAKSRDYFCAKSARASWSSGRSSSAWSQMASSLA